MLYNVDEHLANNIDEPYTLDAKGSHYSLAQDTFRLKAWAKKAHAFIKKNFAKENVYLVYTGMSGIAAATAITMQQEEDEKEYGMIYIRKKEEVAHGGPIEDNGVYEWEKDKIFIFVDDFLCSGETFMRCYERLSYYNEGTVWYAVLQKYTSDTSTSRELPLNTKTDIYYP